jgi:hypothetical protein
MVEWIKGVVEHVLKVPPAPSAPPGDEGTTRVFRASSRYYLYRLIGWALARGFALLGVALAAGSSYLALRSAGSIQRWLLALEVLVIGLFLLQTLFSYAALRLDYEKRWYLVTDRSLRIREGVLHVREMTIAFANIRTSRSRKARSSACSASPTCAWTPRAARAGTRASNRPR